MTIVKGRFLKPDGTPITNVQVQAFLSETAGESAGIEIYASNTSITTASDSSGDWQLSLWANSNGVTDTKYVFVITYPVSNASVRYEVSVPNEVEVFFSDLLASYSASLRAQEIYSIEASQYNFNITQGNSVRKTFSLLDSSNQPMDLTGWSAFFVAQYANQTVITKEILSSVEGFKLNLTPAETYTLSNTPLNYELVMVSANDVIKLLYGSITVIPTFVNVYQIGSFSI